MRSNTLTFPNSSGQTLPARLDLPVDGKAIAYALFAHCSTCTKNLRAVTNISRALTQQGFGVLRFDFTGLGDSDGVEGKVDQIIREIKLEGPLTAEPRVCLMAIADKCPVHRTLHNEINVVTPLVEFIQ